MVYLDLSMAKISSHGVPRDTQTNLEADAADVSLLFGSRHGDDDGERTVGPPCRLLVT